MTGIRIHGDGVAARCCAHLLAQAGLAVSFEATARPRLPVILLSQLAQQLIRDIFGPQARFDDAPRVCRRIVAWGANAAPVELAHEAAVVSEEILLERLGLSLPEPAAVEAAEWSVCSARPLPGSVTEHRFGSRMASTMSVELQRGAEAEACWIESLSEGWLFLITSAPGAGWLVAVGTEADELLAESRLIAPRIAARMPASGRFESAARMVSPICAPGWLACGSAAMGFDPISGDGTAQAVREAILASAVLVSVGRGGDCGELLAHYQARLTAGFQRHLAHCLKYYASGCEGGWWRREVAATERGLEWCEAQLRGHGPFRYQLNGLELQPAG